MPVIGPSNAVFEVILQGIAHIAYNPYAIYNLELFLLEQMFKYHHLVVKLLKHG